MTHNLTKSLFIMLVMIVLLVAAPSLAGEKTISMFVPDTHWPPYFIDETKESGGSILVEVLKAVSSPMGYAIKTETLPNKRGWMMLEQGDVDVHAKAKEWVCEPDKFLWTDPFMQSEDVLLWLASNFTKYENPTQLYGKKIAAIKNFVYPSLENHFGPDKIQRIDVLTPYAMFQLLEQNRVDAALVNRVETQWSLRNNPELKAALFHIDDIAIDSADYRYVFTKSDKWKPFIAEFNRRLRIMKKDGSLNKILSRYR